MALHSAHTDMPGRLIPEHLKVWECTSRLAVTSADMQADAQQAAPAQPQATATADKAPSQPQFPPPKPPSSLPAGTKRKLAEASVPAATKRRITPEKTRVQPIPMPATVTPAATTSQQQPQTRPPTAAAEAAISSRIAFELPTGLHVELGRESLPLGDQPEPGVRVLEALQQGSQWQVVCHSGGQRQWSDEVQGKVTAVGGSMHFSGAGFQSGALQV